MFFLSDNFVRQSASVGCYKIPHARSGTPSSLQVDQFLDMMFRFLVVILVLGATYGQRWDAKYTDCGKNQSFFTSQPFTVSEGSPQNYLGNAYPLPRLLESALSLTASETAKQRKTLFTASLNN